jgi:hypothetical protein
MFDRWRKLLRSFYSDKKGTFDISKVGAGVMMEGSGIWRGGFPGRLVDHAAAFASVRLSLTLFDLDYYNQLTSHLPTNNRP